MAKKAPGMKPLEISDNLRISELRSWESTSPVKQDVLFSGKVLVLALPCDVFEEGAVDFNSFKLSTVKGIAFAQAFQILIRTLQLASQRCIMDNIPVTFDVYLETLRTSLGHTVEYRLFVLEKPDAKIKLKDVYYEVCGVDQPRAAPQALPWQQNNGAAPMAGADLSVRQPVQGRRQPPPQQAPPYQPPPDRVNSNELWMLVRGVEKMRAMESVISKKKYVPGTGGPADPYVTYSLSNAIINATNDKARGVCEMQRNITFYYEEDEVQIKLSKDFGLYRVRHSALHVDRFMLRTFPHTQFTPEVEWFAEFVQKMKMLSLKRELALVAHKRGKKDKKWVRNALYGSDAHAVRPENAEDTEAEWTRLAEELDERDGYIIPGAVQMYKHTNEELVNIQLKMDINLLSEDGNSSNLGYDDQLSALRVLFFDNLCEIERHYNGEIELYKLMGVPELNVEAKKRRDDWITMLSGIMSKHFDRLIFSVKETGISTTLDKAQAKARGERWFEKLENGDFETLINFRELSAGANYFVKLTRFFKEGEDVTFHGTMSVILLIAMSNCWVRDLNSPNLSIVMIGDAAGGKSFVGEQLMKNTGGEDCWKRITAQSRKADLNDQKKCHMMQFNDDMTLSVTTRSEDGADAEHRQLMTTGQMFYSYTKNDPRELVNIHVILKGMAVQCTNVGPVQLMGEVGQQRRAQVEATLSRYWFLNVNNFSDDFYSVMGSNCSGAKADNIQKLRKTGRQSNGLMWLMCGYVHMMLEMLCGTKSIDMTAADICLLKMTERLEKNGVKIPNNREVTKIMRWLKEWVIHRTLFENYFIRTGAYFQKKFMPSQIVDIDFICTEEDAIMAFSVFLPNLYQPEEVVVTKILRDMAKKFIDRGDGLVTYGDPTNSNKRAAFRFNAETNQPSSADRDVTDVLNRLAEGSGRKRHGSFPDDEEASETSFDRRHKRTRAAEPPEPEHQLFSYVRFDMSFQNLVEEIQQRLNGMTNLPSISQLDVILNSMKKRMIDTFQYYNKRVTDAKGAVKYIPTKKGTDSTSMRALVLHDGAVYINYEVLFGTVHSNIIEDCIRAVQFEKTIPRKVLTCIPLPDFNWLPSVVELKATNTEMIINNARHITPSAQIALTGQCDPNFLDPIQREPFIKFDSDIDTYCLMNYYSQNERCRRGEEIEKIIERMHPIRMRERLKNQMIEGVVNGDLPENMVFLKYPEAFIDEYKSIRTQISNFKKNNDTSGMRIIKSSELLNMNSRGMFDESSQHQHERELIQSSTANVMNSNIEHLSSHSRSPVLNQRPSLPAPPPPGSMSLFQYYMNANPSSLFAAVPSTIPSTASSSSSSSSSSSRLSQ